MSSTPVRISSHSTRIVALAALTSMSSTLNSDVLLQAKWFHYSPSLMCFHHYLLKDDQFQNHIELTRMLGLPPNSWPCHRDRR
jgi:hypothetical protein